MARLEIVDVVVRFGGIVAVNGASMTIDPGQVTALMGPNGAGKTTLFNVVTGLQEPTEGTVLLDGDDITGWSPQQRARAGIGRTFQRLEVFGSLSVRDNVLVAAEIHQSSRGRGRGAESPSQTADRLLARVGVESFADHPADAVPTGIARLTELARALAIDPQALLLDEPSSGLGEDETERFAQLLLDLAGEGRAVLLVEHDVDLLMSVSSVIHVLDFGRVIAAGPPEEVQANADVQAAYLGAEVGA